MSEAAMRATPEPAAHAMMPSHWGTTIAPAAHEGETPIPRTTEQRRQHQYDDDEGQHCEIPPFFDLRFGCKEKDQHHGIPQRKSCLLIGTGCFRIG